MVANKRFFQIVLLLLIFNKGYNQSFLERSHLGIGIGAMKYMGDIRSPYTKFAFQGTYAYELTDHFDIRMQAFLGSIGASDQGTPPYLNEWIDEEAGIRNQDARPHPFNSRIQEGSLMIQYNLLNMNAGSKWTPYGFIGIGYFHYTPYYTTYNSNQNRFVDYKYDITSVPRKFNIPFGGGIKYALNENIRLFGEGNFRYTTVDDIDALSVSGRSKSNDYYYSFMVGVTFRLGGDYSKKAKSTGKSSSRKGCPPVYL